MTRLKKAMRVVSFDWDYFVEEDPMLDWGHREDGLFYDTMWQIRRVGCRHNGKGFVQERVDLTKAAPFRGDAMSLIALAYRMKPKRICVAESHAAILQILKGVDAIELVNIDAHHDILYSKMPCEHVDCGNWGGHLMQQHRVNSWTQVYPEWRKKSGFDVDKFPMKFARDLCPDVQVVYTDRLHTVKKAWRSTDWLFICRSGCWVPPEYDERLAKVCEMLGVKPLPARSLDAIEKAKAS